MSSIEQDWKPVTFNRPPTKVEQVRKTGTVLVKKHDAGNNHNSDRAVDSRKLEEQEVGHVPTADLSLGKALEKARSAKKLSQSDLDKKCSFPANTVKSYENSTAVINQQYLSKLEKELGVKLPRPPKKIQIE